MRQQPPDRDRADSSHTRFISQIIYQLKNSGPQQAQSSAEAQEAQRARHAAAAGSQAAAPRSAHQPRSAAATTCPVRPLTDTPTEQQPAPPRAPSHGRPPPRPRQWQPWQKPCPSAAASTQLPMSTRWMSLISRERWRRWTSRYAHACAPHLPIGARPQYPSASAVGHTAASVAVCLLPPSLLPLLCRAVIASDNDDDGDDGVRCRPG
jgi:hypothetical protein